MRNAVILLLSTVVACATSPKDEIDPDAGCAMWRNLDERDRSIAIGQVVGSAIENVDPDHGAFIAECMRGRRAEVLAEIDRRCVDTDLATRTVMGRSLDAALDRCIQEKLESR